MNFCPAPTPTTLLIVGLLALLTPSEALCQNWIVTGTVLDSAGGPIQGADLDLVDPNEPGGEVPVTADNTDAELVYPFRLLMGTRSQLGEDIEICWQSALAGSWATPPWRRPAGGARMRPWAAAAVRSTRAVRP